MKLLQIRRRVEVFLQLGVQRLKSRIIRLSATITGTPVFDLLIKARKAGTDAHGLPTQLAANLCGGQNEIWLQLILVRLFQ